MKIEQWLENLPDAAKVALFIGIAGAMIFAVGYGAGELGWFAG